MPDRFAYHTTELHRLGGELAELGPGVMAGLDGQGLTGHSGAWGGDEPGTAFGEAFTELGTLAGELLSAVTEGFARSGQNV